MIPRKFLKPAIIASSALSIVFLVSALTMWPVNQTRGSVDKGLRVGQRVRDIGDVPLGADIIAEFTLINTGTQSVDILGSTYTCSQQACLKADGLPTRIEAWKSKGVLVHIKTNGRGQLADEVVLFTDAPLQREVSLKVVGHVIDGLNESDATD